MKLEITIHGLAELLNVSTGILHKLNEIVFNQERIMALLDNLTAQVAANTTVEASAVTLINGLAAQIAAAGTDPTKLAALQSQLKTSADALSAAIVANTPSAPPAP